MLRASNAQSTEGERIMKMFGVFARLLPAVVLLLLACGARAAPLDAATQQELLSLYDSYNKAMLAGKIDAALALMSAELRSHAEGNLKSEDDRKEAMAMAEGMTPDKVEVVHTFIDKAGSAARLVTVASKKVPEGVKNADAPPPGTIMRNGMTLGFVKEGGAWKFDEQLFGPDPTEVTGCKSETAEPRDAYDAGHSVSAGGPIVRVEFKPDYTLVVYSVVDEANCAFLPAKGDLAKLKVDPAALVPYAIVSLEGIAHRSDPQKMLADKVEVQAEE